MSTSSPQMNGSGADGAPETTAEEPDDLVWMVRPIEVAPGETEAMAFARARHEAAEFLHRHGEPARPGYILTAAEIAAQGMAVHELRHSRRQAILRQLRLRSRLRWR